MERTETMTSASAPAHELGGSYVDWPAVLGGTVVASAIAAMFTAFGAALGLSAISAEPGEGSGTFAMILTGLWLVLTLLASYMAGGYVAGRMRRRVDRSNADEVTSQDGINGLVVWGLGMLISAWLVSAAVSTTASAVGQVAESAGSAVGTAVEATGSAVGGAVGGLAQGVAGAAGAALPDEATVNPVDYINNTLLRPNSVTGSSLQDEAAIAQQTAGILGNVLRTGQISDEERNYLVSATVSRTSLTEQEAGTRVDQAVQGVQDARTEAERIANEARAEAERLAEEARQTAIDAAETARKGAVLTGFTVAAASLVAAAASVMGAVRGGRHRDENRMFGGFSYR